MSEIIPLRPQIGNIARFDFLGSLIVHLTQEGVLVLEEKKLVSCRKCTRGKERRSEEEDWLSEKEPAI
jgi:hypothetical protein